MHVHQAGVNLALEVALVVEVFVQPNFFQELFASESVLRVFGDGEQQVELERGQQNLL